MLKHWDKDQVLVVSENFDERKFRSEHLAEIQTPDILLLGSSRVMLVDREMFSPRFSVYNSGVSNGTVQDYIAFWQLLKEKNKIPKNVIFFIDPWMLNETNEELIGWLSIFFPYQRFLVGSGGGALPFSLWFDGIKAKGLQISDNLSNLINWPMLKLSLTKLVHHSTEESVEWTLLERSKFKMDFPAVLSDGSRLYPKSKMRGDAELEIDLEKNIYFKELSRWGLKLNDLKLFNLLLKDMKANDVRVAIVIPPFHHLFFSKFKEQSVYPKFVKEFTGSLRNLKTENLSEVVCDVFDPDSFGCSVDGGFMDNLHMRKPCVIKALHHCFEGSSYWNGLLRVPEIRWY